MLSFIIRDIKADNILLDKLNNIKIADFGIAVMQQDLDSEMPSGMGSPYWMAPEVIEAQSVTPKSDIWSVGCLAVELFTGKPPYYDLNPMSALFHICADEEIPIDNSSNGISPMCMEFIRECFVKDPIKRKSAGALLHHRWFITNSQHPNNTRYVSSQGRFL